MGMDTSVGELRNIDGAFGGVIEQGTGHPVVFLHSVGLDRYAWGPVLAELPNDIRAIAIDLPMHGRDATSPVTDWNGLVTGIMDAIESLGLKRFSLCGLSLGGSLALDISLRYPDRVSSLVFAAAIADGLPALMGRAIAAEREGVEAQISATLERWFVADDIAKDLPSVAYARARLEQMSIRHWAATWRALAGIRLEHRLADVCVPTLVVAGEADASVPVPVLDRIAAAIPDARSVVLEGVPHQIALHDPVVFARAVDGFLLKNM